MDPIELKWEGLFATATQLRSIPEYSGVYFWSVFLQGVDRVIYIGSSGDVRLRIVQEVESNLGGGWWFRDWKDPEGQTWLPKGCQPDEAKSPAKRILRLLAFIGDAEMRALALQRIQSANVYCAPTATADEYKIAERELIKIGLANRSEGDPVYRWLENEGLQSTEGCAEPVQLIHVQGTGSVRCGDVFAPYRKS